MIDRQGDIAIVKLNRPENRNALGFTISGSLLAAIDEVEADPSLSVMVLTGEGKTFCAGGKIGEMMAADGVDTFRRDAANRDFVTAVARLRKSSLPVVCALNGVNVGGGVALAMACDLVVAEEDAAYLFAFGRVGATVADAGCSYLLPRMVGVARARHILLTGGRVDATEGEAIGLFAEVAPKGELMAVTLKLARTIADASPRAAAAASKQILLHAETADFDTTLWYEHYMQTYFLNSDEAQVRVRAMIEKIWRK
ncbi:MAG TPA: enoyl-CoA hydratase/isomerase family protein [Sphingomicrobium sp.]